MAKTKLQKHLEELGENTSGGSHDAVTFSGKGLGFLSGLFKSAKKDEEDFEDEDDLEEGMDEEEDEEEDEKPKKKSRRAKKNEANGGDLEEEDEDDLEDPGQEGEEEIITNKGKRVKGTGAVKKNTRNFDERRFEKSLNDFEEDHADVLDASEALADLSGHVRSMAKSTNAGFAELREQNVLLGKAVRELLKSNAALAADLELVKNQPATSPSTGFLTYELAKSEGEKGRKLRKSEVADIIAEAMNDGLVESRSLAQLSRLNTQAELQHFVNGLPSEVRAKF